MEKRSVTDYDIRLWGNTTFITDHKKVDYMVDNEVNVMGIQHNNLDINQEKKLIELLDKVVESIRAVDEYLILKGER